MDNISVRNSIHQLSKIGSRTMHHLILALSIIIPTTALAENEPQPNQPIIQNQHSEQYDDQSELFHPDNMALACVYNTTGTEITIDWAYGEESWKRYLIPANRNMVVSFPYNLENPKDNTAPSLNIRFNRRSYGPISWIYRFIPQYEAPVNDCSMYGKRYIFMWTDQNRNEVNLYACLNNRCDLSRETERLARDIE